MDSSNPEVENKEQEVLVGVLSSGKIKLTPLVSSGYSHQKHCIMMGMKKSAKKAAASRENGKLGGRGHKRIKVVEEIKNDNN